MPVRNGLLSTLRARGRTALFTLLILVLTVALALGLGMWAYSGGLLAQMEEQYTSVALVEYMGENYPDEDAADEDARAALELLDQEAIAAVDGVELWEPARSTLVSVDGYKNAHRDSVYGSSAVVVATIKPEYVTASGTVAEEDLPESMALLYYEIGDPNNPEDCTPLPDGSGSMINTYGFFSFRLPGMEPLELPYYSINYGDFVFNYETFDKYRSQNQKTGLYLREGVYEGYSEEEPEEPCVVLCTEVYENGSSSIWFEIRGELPQGYDPIDLKFLLWDHFYRYEEWSGTYVGFNETVLSPDTYGRIRWALYSPYGTDSMTCYFSSQYFGFKPEEGKSYLLHGAFVAWGGGARNFRLMDFPTTGGLLEQNEDGSWSVIEREWTEPWLELSGDDDPALTDSIFTQWAHLYQISNNTAVLTASNDIAALELFQQGTLYLTDGRLPQAGEAGVCVLSGAMAEYLQVGVGDVIDLEILDSPPENRNNISPTGDRRALEIVGVTNPSSDYADRIWVSSAEGEFSSPLFGYSLGMAVLDNRKAVQAAEELSALLPIGVQLTLYDQGYAAAARPIQAMESAAQAITLASACGALAVLVLFAFLFVGRQRETVGVLVSLGTPKGKIRLWLLSGAAAVSGAAALLGSFIGSQTLSGVVAAAMETVERLYAADTRYSEAAVGMVKESVEAAAIPDWPAPAAGVAVFLAALALCLIFLRHARKENAPKKGKVSVRVPKGRTSTGGRGSLRFAALSARRGGRRSVVVIAAALVLTLFVSLLSASTQGWNDQVDSLYADSELDGRIVSLSGRKQTGLVIPTRDVQMLWKSGYLGDVSVSLGWHYEETSGPDIPSIYSYSSLTTISGESLANWIAQQPILSAVNSLSAAAEFYYTDRPEVQWLEGWDESCLADTSYPSVLEGIYTYYYEARASYDYVYPVLVGTRFLENSDLELGDTLSVKLYIPVYLDKDYMVEWPVNFQIVGSFTSTGTKDNFCTPLGMWCSPEWLYGEGDRELSARESNMNMKSLEEVERWVYFRTRFETCRFTLKSAYELEDLRNWLAENEYSQVGVSNRSRITILLRDQSFVETIGGLNRYISFSNILFPVLFAVVGLMGFIISWLMVSSRRMEFAVMRGLGASPRRAFSSFFLEQAALCLLGCLIGALTMTALYQSGAVWLAAAGFLVCYLAGCALSVLAAGRTNLMLLLSERE